MSARPPLIGVIDLETTGRYPFRHDRVVEVAAVVIQLDGRIEREFVTLVNPGRDIGPSSIHGLESQDILHAPRFEEIAGDLLDALRGTVAIAAHNAHFDRQFLEYEFERIKLPFPNCTPLCTKRLGGWGTLASCCADYGIAIDGQEHHALTDARACARLLSALLAEEPDLTASVTGLSPLEWPVLHPSGKRPVTRDESRRRQAEPPTYLQRLLGRVQVDGLASASEGAVMAYAALIEQALEDRNIDESEGEALVETATKWGLSRDQIELTHRNYFNQLAIAAVTDGIVTETERRDLKLVARLLGQEKQDLDLILQDAAAKVLEARQAPAVVQPSESGLAGKSVCFTGELKCRYAGQPISRELAERLATEAGLVPADSVTKKLDLLVVSDPHTLSGKAKKARQYGTRIMHEPVFWKAIGVEVE